MPNTNYRTFWENDSFPVDPSADRIEGDKAHADFEHLPAKVDAVRRGLRDPAAPTPVRARF